MYTSLQLIWRAFLDVSTDRLQMIFVHKLISLPLLHFVCLYTWSLGQLGTAGSVWIRISSPSYNAHAYPDQFRLTFSEELSDASRSSDLFDAAGGSSSIMIKLYSPTCCCCYNSRCNKAWHSLSKSSSISSLSWQFLVVFWSI